jgi:aminoglycoside phosphotransferase (APT) family kinase protein
MTRPAADTVPDVVRDWAEPVIGPISRSWLLSGSHSRVWRARSASGDWTVKHLQDRSSDARVEAAVLGSLPGTVRARRIRALREEPDGSVFVLAPYVPGRTLDEALPGAEADRARDWAEQVCRIVDAVAAVPVQGYGAVRLESDGRTLRAGAPDWFAFLVGYLERQRHKAPRLAALRHGVLLAAMRDLEPRLAAAADRPRLLHADVNLRNFVVDGPVVACVNLPVAWSGDPAAVYGEALVHWSGTAGEAVFRRAGRAAGRLLDFYAAFHAYVILAYVERFSSEPLDRAAPWGGSTPLLELFDRHAAAACGGPKEALSCQ